MTVANDGVVINQMGNFITCSNGEHYTLTGMTLTGPKGVVSVNVHSASEAANIVVGLHGGKRF